MSETPDPKNVGVRPLLHVQSGIPATRTRRDALLREVRRQIRQAQLTPPVPLETLKDIAQRSCSALDLDASFYRFATVLAGNEAWRDTLGEIPYQRRLLLLPQCLRDEDHCPARIDEYGLVCSACGRCILHGLQAEAERLGYVVMIAEGSAVVTRLIESGQIDAVVGVSCLSVLERVFPYMEAGAVPGAAIPLLRDGCRQTSLDVDWLREAMYLTTAETKRQLDLESLRKRVAKWFEPEAVAQILGAPGGRTQQIAQEWLVKGGKRWRPFLAVCAAESLAGDKADRLGGLDKLALAVECFHKASLIHDDIEDGDQTRYDAPCLHAQYGVAFALNVGDFLLGEGYRLIGQCQAENDRKVRMFAVAAGGHRDLCIGQGAELWWTRGKETLVLADILEIFQRKTAPAFEVALRMGAILGRGDDALGPALTRYSRALGIAYQIRDDLDDFCCAEDRNDLEAGRLSVLPSLAIEQGDVPAEKLEPLWTEAPESHAFYEALACLRDSKAVLVGLKLMEAWKRRAVEALEDIDSVALKSLLRRVVGRIFCDFEVMGCCDDLPSRDAPGRKPGH